MKFQSIYIFLITFFFPTYQFIAWIWDKFGGLIKRLLVKSERDVIVWAHYEKHALREGHKAKSPAECMDGDCVQIVK